MTKILTIGVVTYNHASSIAKVLVSINTHIAPVCQTAVIIWDNGSSDNTTDIAEQYAGQAGFNLEVVKNTENLGFGRAHNAILNKCKSDFHLIYNPDLYATEGCLEPLLNLLQENREVAIAAPKFLYPDGQLQPLCRRDPTVVDLFLRFFAIGPLKPVFSFYLHRGVLLDTGYNKVMDVPISSGALMCARTSDLKALGGFDEDYFVYFEDYDLCRKVRRSGAKIRFTPSSRFIHEWKRESRKSFKALKMLFFSAWIYFRKWGVRWV